MTGAPLTSATLAGAAPPALPPALAALQRSGVLISVEQRDLDAARRDLWPRDTLRMRAGALPPAPRAVAWPRDRGQVQALITAAVEDGLPVVPYGAGSGVCGGARGHEGALVIDLKKLDRVVSIDPVRRLAHVEAGCLGQLLEDQLALAGWTTGHSPSSIACSTVGGWAAARSAGQFSSRYGVFADICVGAAMASPAGPLTAGLWAPAGAPDQLPELLGAEGSLGVFTDLLVRIAPLPAERWLRGYVFPTLEDAWATMRALLQDGLWPSVLRLYDPLDTRIGGRTGKKSKERPVLKRLRSAVEGVPALRSRLLELPLSLPKLLNRLADGLGQGVLLIIGFEGSEAERGATLPLAIERLSQRGRDLGPGPGEHWYAHRHDVSYKMAPIFAGGAWADTMEVAARWSDLPRLYRDVREAIGRTAVVMAHMSHAYPEGCSIYFSFAAAGDEDVYDRTWEAGTQAALAAGGTVSHHHGVGRLKAAAAAEELGPALVGWSALRRDLDPEGHQNPGCPFPLGAEHAVPRGPAPPPLALPGPVVELGVIDRLAKVDPRAEPAEIEAELARMGWRLAWRPDRPLLPWLAAARPCLGLRHVMMLYSAAFSFTDTAGARREVVLGRAPRSAAGPDLRLRLIAEGDALGATLDWVELPVLPLSAPLYAVEPRFPSRGQPRALPAPLVASPLRGELHPDDLRPQAVLGERWIFAGPAARARAAALGSAAAVEDLPPRAPADACAPHLPAAGLRPPWLAPEPPEALEGAWTAPSC
jgi:alkyldihydroxyacetonephosphate synthase